MNKHRSLGLIVFFILSSLLLFISCSRNNKTVDSEFVFSAKLVKPVDAVDLEKRLKAELVRRYERMYTGYMYYGMMGGSMGQAVHLDRRRRGGTGSDSIAPGTSGSDSEAPGFLCYFLFRN